MVKENLPIFHIIMNCQISFIIGLGLLGASFATMTVSQDQIKTLSDKLSPELRKI